MSAARAVALNFNGTLSHDGPRLYAVYRDMFSEHGRPRHAGRELECDPNGLLVHARLDAPPSARHVRIEVTDAARRKAWANPFPV